MKADLAAQYFYQIAFPTSTHLHLPEVIGISCTILKKVKGGDVICGQKSSKTIKLYLQI